METRQRVLALAGEMGASLSPEGADRILLHLTLLEAANARFNLTAIPAQDWVWAHVMDSLSCLPELIVAPAGTCADLGSGGGFPGVPLAIAADREFVLVESVKKKAAFLEEVRAATGIAGRVAPVRAEELAASEPQGFAVVTARALSALPSLVELAAPLLEPGGRLICLKADVQAKELGSGEQAASISGMRPFSSRVVRVPLTDAKRTIVVYERVGQPRVRLPRRSGMAQRQPLA